ncbi:7TM diverse intracellular signaling domain-containing protein [Oligoflexus tunisiensis]|uniref:7TM diverse intracellular signaling domain-containing protein n=1 Tax=Oligoflexus tunisiensis TaxID=708132 RepID=UPI001C403796|nr:7TM diverse intracellular signaling domain-containing protein [Oligoflexus tunisiensis]
MLISCLLARSAKAQETSVLDVAALQARQDITPLAWALLEQEGQATPEEILKLFPVIGKKAKDLMEGGYHNGHYWVRVALRNSAPEPRAVRIQVNNRVLKHFEYFALPPASDEAPALSRLQARLPVLHLVLAPGQETVVLLKMQFSLQDDLSLQLEPTSLKMQEKTDRTIFAVLLLFGIIAGLLIFNIGLFVLTRDAVFCLHALAACCLFADIFLLNGLSYYLLESDQWNYLAPAFGNYSVATAIIFAQAYLNIKALYPLLHRLLNVVTVIGLAGGTFLLMGFSKQVLYLTDMNLILVAVLGLSIMYLFPPHRHRVMRFYVLGWFGLAAASLVWVLAEYDTIGRNVLTENSLNIGLCFEMIIISLGLADQINHLKNRLKENNQNLEALVAEKTRDLTSIMEHIPLGIFMIKSDFRIHRYHSRYLREIFRGQDLEKSQAADLIFGSSHLNSDERSRAESCLAASLGEERINFDMNVESLPLELRRPVVEGSPQIFDLTWNVIENAEKEVDKILVTMRDVTEIRKLQELARDQKEELEFLGEILAIPTTKFLRFIQSCRDLIQENFKLTRSQGVQKRNLDVLKMLFINMHTIKGAARSLCLKKMAGIFHEVEQYYAHLQANSNAPWNADKMRQDLEEALEMVAFYERIAEEKLGRSIDHSHVVEFRIEQIEAAYQDLCRSTMKVALPAEAMQGIEQVKALFHYKIFRDAREVLEEISACLPILAKDLKKEVPQVQIDTRGIRLGSQCEDLFRNVFVHLFRNTMDHGLETAAERQGAGKSRQGRITIALERRESTVVLVYADDGRGLDLQRIREIGRGRGLLRAPDEDNNALIADLIFHSGFSTTDQVTEISGRGVGMDAVRRFIRSMGGDISLRLETPRDHFCAFSFLVTLPSELFDQLHTESLLQAV